MPNHMTPLTDKSRNILEKYGNTVVIREFLKCVTMSKDHLVLEQRCFKMSACVAKDELRKLPPDPMLCFWRLRNILKPLEHNAIYGNIINFITKDIKEKDFLTLLETFDIYALSLCSKVLTFPVIGLQFLDSLRMSNPHVLDRKMELNDLGSHLITNALTGNESGIGSAHTLVCQAPAA